MKKYYYEIDFYDGRKIRREMVSKKTAKAVFDAMEYEMVFFGVKHVSWGLM